MKKINMTIMLFAAVLFGLLLTACTDNPNEWTVDQSVKRQYPPTSLTAEIDSFSLGMDIKIGTLKSAAGYEVQISESPLIGGGLDDPTGVATFQVDTTGEMSIPRVSDSFTINESATLYVRARAVGKDGTKSTWYTNGLIYNEGYIADEKLEASLKSASAYPVKAPTGLWATKSEESTIQLNWYMLPASKSKQATCYCAAPSYIINETMQAEGAAETAYKYSLTDEDLEAYTYTWSELGTGKSYTFSIYDAKGQKIGTTTASTEFAPNMNLAYSCLVGADDVEGAIHKADFTTAATPFTVAITNTAFGTEPATFTFNNESAGGWSTGRNDYVTTPDNSYLNFKLRGQLKKNCTVTINVPSDGRLYFYGYTAGTFTVTQGSGDAKTTTTVDVTATKQKLPSIEDPTSTVSAYITSKVRLTKGEATLQVGATSLYFYGFCFVPDDPKAKTE